MAYVLIAGHSRFGVFLELLNWRISGCFVEQSTEFSKKSAEYSKTPSLHKIRYLSEIASLSYID